MNIDEKIKIAQNYNQEGHLEQAKALCIEVLKIQPQNYNILNLLAVISYKLNEYDLAIEYWGKALEQNPANANIHYNLGNTYSANNQFDKAIYHYQKTLEIIPNG